MANLAGNVAKIIDQQFTTTFGKGGFTEEITFRYFQSAGEYDVESDTQEDVYTNLTIKDVIVAKPGSDDMKAAKEVVVTDAKLIIPGLKMPILPEADTDKVIRYGINGVGGEVWDVRKVVGVPGHGVVIVFIYRT